MQVNFAHSRNAEEDVWIGWSSHVEMWDIAVLETPLLLSMSNLGARGPQSVSNVTASANSVPEQELKGTD